jgi:hypothetical protein
MVRGKFLARFKKQRKRQPPVSLHPLEPEDALAGLLRVKPEKEEPPADEEREQESEEESKEPS